MGYLTACWASPVERLLYEGRPQSWTLRGGQVLQGSRLMGNSQPCGCSGILLASRVVRSMQWPLRKNQTIKLLLETISLLIYIWEQRRLFSVRPRRRVY